MISRKVLAQALTTLVLGIAGYVATRQGLHISPATSAEFSGVVAWLGGVAAGWLAKEDPRLFGGAASPAAPNPPRGPVSDSKGLAPATHPLIPDAPTLAA